jgi:tRNA1(Val) A37 N6-methylase TrmN6
MADCETQTADRLLGGRVTLAQPAQGYRVAIDPILLAAAVAAGAGETVLDAGCGSGAAALCLAARLPECRVVGVERDAVLYAIALRNVAANGFAGRIDLVEQDIAAFAKSHRGRFDQAMCNPPFYKAGAHTASPSDTKATAHGESALPLDGWIAAMATCLKPAGKLTLIHRADRIADLLAALDRRFGAVMIFPLWPKPGEPAKRIMLQAIKGRRTPPSLLPGLVLHTANGAFTAEAQNILRDAAGLAFSGASA